MEKRVDERIGTYDRRSYLGEEARSHDEAEAKRLLEFGLNALNLKADEKSVLTPVTEGTGETLMFIMHFCLFLRFILLQTLHPNRTAPGKNPFGSRQIVGITAVLLKRFREVVRRDGIYIKGRVAMELNLHEVEVTAGSSG